MIGKKLKRRRKIQFLIRKKINGSPEIPRLSVFRSNKDIYAQLIDDKSGNTIVSYSSRNKSIKGTKGTKVEIAKQVGINLGKAAVEKGIKSVVFDRSGFLYHGRVKALADGAREEGLKF